jgi:hypothetical protein
MSEKPFVKITAWTFRDHFPDGPALIVSETPDRRLVRIAIRAINGTELAVHLGYETWQSLCDLRYEWQGPEVRPEPEPAETEA